MNRTPRDPQDQELRARLRAALAPGIPPPHLSARVDRLASVGLRNPADPLSAAGRRHAIGPDPRVPLWGDLLAPLAGVALLLALLTGAVLKLVPALLREAAAGMTNPLSLDLPTVAVPAAALPTLLMPLALLLLIEVMRGGPTLRRWFH